jgi:hypothetical protein
MDDEERLTKLRKAMSYQDTVDAEVSAMLQDPQNQRVLVANIKEFAEGLKKNRMNIRSEDSRFSHAYDLAFEIESDEPDASDVTSDDLKAALLRRIDNIDAANDWFTACELYETNEID